MLYKAKFYVYYCLPVINILVIA